MPAGARGPQMANLKTINLKTLYFFVGLLSFDFNQTTTFKEDADRWWATSSLLQRFAFLSKLKGFAVTRESPLKNISHHFHFYHVRTTLTYSAR